MRSPGKAWHDAGEFDRELMKDYKPGPWAPLDAPIGAQGSYVLMWGMILLVLGIAALIVYEVVS